MDHRWKYVTKKKAPNFCLLNQDNKKICLKDFRNNWVVLYFYPKDNSKSCTLEALDFTNNLQNLQELDTIILGVSPDLVKSHKNFAQKHNLKFMLLSDPEHEILEKYGAWQLKKMYGKEHMGVIRSTFIINPEGYIEKEWKKVRVKGHVEEVKQKLLELQK